MLLDPVHYDTITEALTLDVTGLSYEQLGAAATRLGIALDRVHAQLIAVTVEAEQTSAFAHEAFAANTTDWLRDRTVMHKAEAKRDALLARDLIPLAAIRGALGSGVISVEEARILCRPMRNPRVRRVYPHHEAAVLEEVLRLPKELWDRCITIITDRLDTDGPTPDGEPDTNHGHINRKLNGRWTLDADLDPLDGALVATVLESIVRQLRHDATAEGADAPAHNQLVGHAWVEMARRAEASDAHNPNTVGVNVIVDQDTISHLDDPTHKHTGGCCPPATIDGMPIPRAQLRMLLCDSILRGLVVASDGAILRLGTTTREPSRELRLYLTLRDGGCTFPGCTQPSSRTQAHHIRWVSHDGPTDHDNLILCCPRHHALVHAGIWEPELNPDHSVTWTHVRSQRQQTRQPPRQPPPINLAA